MQKIIKSKSFLLGALFLAVLFLSGCTTPKEKVYNKGYYDGYDDAMDEVNYKSRSYSAGYDEGYSNCENGLRRQY